MARDPQDDLQRLRAIHSEAQAGRYAQAAELAQAALADGVQHALLYNVAALQLEQEGRVSAAETLLRRGLQQFPTDGSLRNALGLCLMRLERAAEAVLQFDALIAADASLAFAHTSRGAAMLALGRITAAQESYRRAIDLDPQQGVALAGLASLASSRGAYAEARSWGERALAVLPGHPEAVLSVAAAELGERKPKRAEARVRSLLADGTIAPLHRAYASGLLGDILDAQKRTAEAFAAYSACNQALHELYAGAFAGQTSALAYVNSMLEYFGQASPQWKVAPGKATVTAGEQGHVFLLGFPRSGTTLLEVILEGHPRIVSLEENELLIDGVREFMQRPQDLEQLLHSPPAVLDRLRAAYWKHVANEGIDVAGRIFLDKHPLNTLKLPLIARLFPHARIIFACRDPRDIVLSCFRHRFRMSAPIYELLTIPGAADYYAAVMRLMVCLSDRLPLDTCLVRHEDVVTGFGREMRRICEFLGIEWVPAMGDFALRTKHRAALTPSTAQLVRGLSTEGLGQWHGYRAHLEPVLPILEPWVRRFYYDPTVGPEASAATRS